METEIAALKAQITALAMNMQSQQESFQQHIETIKRESFQQVTSVTQHEEVRLALTDPKDIDLELFKALPKFDGDKTQYRSWRNQAWTFMESIKSFMQHPRYYSALGIVRTKIIGSAADILTNHNTKLNFYSIINRLDYTYADQRPLYVLLDDMKRIVQGRRTLSEFHSEVSKALNLALSKIEMSASQNNAAMLEYANEEAVRTFILGLNSKYTSGTLYSNSPKDLEAAYAIACTIYHDNVNQQFDIQPQRSNPARHHYPENRPAPRYEDRQHRYNPGIQVYGNNQRFQHQQQPQRPVPMEVDNSREFVRTTQNGKYNNPFKRDRVPSNQNINPQKLQRINYTVEEENRAEDLDYFEDKFETGSTFLRRVKGLPCIVTKCGMTGKPVTVLVDTGATNNYISFNCDIGKSVQIRPTHIKTLHGNSVIKSKKVITLFGHHLSFYEIDELNDYDMILGEQGLRVLKAEVNLFDYSLKYKKRIEEQKINYTLDNESYNKEISQIMQRNDYISESLPFTTTIEASIRTQSDDPIWTKQYPYPMADHEFVKSEINKLLKEGIIQPSKSPYNSPIWTVPKKGTDDQGRPKRRMVVDFQKINSHTITDRYPIPDVNMTIQSLGKAKIFSTIDLESGFHQILIKDKDREKTAFSVNGAKYEFVRMPFGLKNAPAIFQRCVDDILREYIGKFAYVYIDDVLIYSSSTEEHIEHIQIIINALHNANMKISKEKSHFFKDSVEYLGHIIKHNRVTVDPNKIETIKKFPEPKTLKELRSFLGLASYYRKFIKNFAKITKPLTIHLRGEQGMVKKNKSAKIEIKLDEAAIHAFEKIKIELQAQVELYQPDFSKPFELTTDASNFAIGAVLAQNRKPIAFISRILSDTEQSYSTNEKELLAIVWALQKLRNYLYGVADLTIYTDHQSLIYSISEKNPNSKLKRWKNLIEEYGAKLVYKPGHQNVVADALSRQQINTSTDCSAHSAQSSPTEIMKKVKQPFNSFKNQIMIIKTNEEKETVSQTIFANHFRHTIYYNDSQILCNKLKEVVRPNLTNALRIENEEIFHFGKDIIRTFPNCTFVQAQTLLIDITNIDRQKEIIIQTHRRAHRNYKNNAQEILLNYYWPNLKKMCSTETNICEICLVHKYERQPNRQPIGKTPIPTRVGEYIQMDIFHMNNNTYLSSIDRYSKYCFIRKLENKLHCHEYIEEVLTQIYSNAKYLMTDNESIFIGNMAKSVYSRLQITHSVTPVHHSTSNAQVERLHSTLIELCQTLAAENKTAPADELYNAVCQYNKTIHSSTGYKPEDVFYNRDKYPDIRETLEQKQHQLLRYHNKNRKIITYKEGDTIYSRTDRRNKTSAKYNKHLVKEDRGDKILTVKGKIIHKDSIRKVAT